MTIEIEKELLERLIENSNKLWQGWQNKYGDSCRWFPVVQQLTADITAAESLIQSPDKTNENGAS